MGKRMLVFIVVFVLMQGCVFGCSALDKEKNDTQAEEQMQSKDVSKGQDEETEENADNQQESTKEDKNQVCVYYSNADTTAFETTYVKVDSFAPQSVLDALVLQGTLTADIDMISFYIHSVDGKDSIELDLNKAFVSYLSNMDTSAEYYVVGALSNTFLEAYNCDQIKITVEGNELSTSHAEYPGYLSMFE